MNTNADSSIIQMPIHNDDDVVLNKQASSSHASSCSMLKWGAIIFALIALVGICAVAGITMSNKSNNIALKSTSTAVSVGGMDVQDTCTPDPAVQNLDFYIAHDSTQLHDIWVSPSKSYSFTVVCKTSTPPVQIAAFEADAYVESSYSWQIPSECTFNEATSRYEIELALSIGSLPVEDYYIYIRSSYFSFTHYTDAVARTNCYAGFFKIGEYKWVYLKDTNGNTKFGECENPPNSHCNTFQLRQAQRECQETNTSTVVATTLCRNDPGMITDCATRVGCQSGQTCTTDNVCLADSVYSWEDVGTVSDCALASTAKCYDYKTRQTKYRCKNNDTGTYVDDSDCTGTKPTSTTITCSQKGTCECQKLSKHTGCDNFLYMPLENDKYEKCDTKIGGCSSTQFCNTGIRDIKMLNGVVTSSELGRCDAKPIDDTDDRSGSNSASIASVIMSVFMVFVAVCVM